MDTWNVSLKRELAFVVVVSWSRWQERLFATAPFATRKRFVSHFSAGRNLVVFGRQSYYLCTQSFSLKMCAVFICARRGLANRLLWSSRWRFHYASIAFYIAKRRNGTKWISIEFIFIEVSLMPLKCHHCRFCIFSLFPRNSDPYVRALTFFKEIYISFRFRITDWFRFDNTIDAMNKQGGFRNRLAEFGLVPWPFARHTHTTDSIQIRQNPWFRRDWWRIRQENLKSPERKPNNVFHPSYRRSSERKGSKVRTEDTDKRRREVAFCCVPRVFHRWKLWRGRAGFLGPQLSYCRRRYVFGTEKYVGSTVAW